MKRFYKTVVSVFTVLCTVSLAAQTNRYVDETGADVGDCTNPSSPCATINYAMDEAANGDIIEIASGVYTETLRISKDLTLRGAGDMQNGGTIIQAHALPGEATERPVTILTGIFVHIEDVIIQHGYNEDYGGGIYVVSGGNLTLSNATVRNNTAMVFGGGLYLVGTANVTLADVNLIENHAISNGGGIMVGNISTLNITDSEFIDNTATRDGGGVYTQGSITFSNTNFTGNWAGHKGGAINAVSSDCILNIEDSNFTNNTADWNGGAISLVYESMTTFTNVEFNNNETLDTGNGGAVFISEATAAFNNATFQNNKVANNDGGAVYASESNVSFNKAQFTSNEAYLLGGGVLSSDSDISFFDTSFEFNSANLGGGAALLSALNNEILIQNSQFKNNEATGDFGGGLLNEGNRVTIVNTLFTENLAADMGGAIASLGELNLINSTISKNESSGTGAGGLYNTIGTVLLKNSIIWGNIGIDAPDIANVNGGTINGSYSLYDDTDVYNDGVFNCTNCLTINPQFTDITTGDFTLGDNSPALDAGDPNTDMSVFPTENNTPIDLAGNERVMNNIIDLGVYETQTLSNTNFSNPEVAIKIYPNPTSNVIHLGAKEEITSVTLSTVTGQVLKTWKNSNSIDLSAYAKGMYFVSVETLKGKVTKTIIKK
ncbi:MAG: hypothetical protein CL526_07865 [Aequorivita sp.]|nr:hypothetical protein [Aequorivita sp.]|tara:strand:- start:11684 stop:13669 length:1986 start_codon:yes stop_codon:yes gene_type:complete